MQRHALAYVCTDCVMLGRSLGRESACCNMRPHPFRALYDLVCELGVRDHICTRTPYCKWPQVPAGCGTDALRRGTVAQGAAAAPDFSTQAAA